MSGRGGGRHFGPAERLINQFVMERERSAATLQPQAQARDYPIPFRTQEALGPGRIGPTARSEMSGKIFHLCH